MASTDIKQQYKFTFHLFNEAGLATPSTIAVVAATDEKEAENKLHGIFGRERMNSFAAKKLFAVSDIRITAPYSGIHTEEEEIQLSHE